MTAIFLIPVYAAVIAYLFLWGMRFVDACCKKPAKRSVKRFAAAVWIFLSLTPLWAFLTPASAWKRHLASISNFWMGCLLYLILLTVFLDVLRLILKKRLRLPVVCRNSRICLIVSGCIVLAGTGTAVILGTHTAQNVEITRYTVKIDKEFPGDDALRIALIADLHMGYSIGSRQIAGLAEQLNALHPDLVCIAGDIFDNHFDALDHPEQIAASFRSVKTTYGIYACFGNHDYEEDILAGFTFDSSAKVRIGEPMRELLKQAGIRTLEDEVLLIDGRFYLAGRKDYSSFRKTGEKRKSPDELLADIDSEKPVFVIDHQPKEAGELAAAGADLDLCGHTHDGQLFPGNLITGLLWENACGLQKKDGMYQIVTSGAGIFGPYMRVGTKSEIAVIDVRFQQNEEK